MNFIYKFWMYICITSVLTWETLDNSCEAIDILLQDYPHLAQAIHFNKQ